MFYMKNPWVIVGVVAVVLFGGAVWYANHSVAESNEDIKITPNSKGNPDAAVTLVEYSDLQCPACAGFEPVIAGMLEQYANELRFEFRHFPLPPRMHPHAFQAALAAEAAGQQGKFFEYKYLLYSNQQKWSGAAVPTTFFLQYASELGLDLDLFKTHMRSSVLKDRIQAEFAEGEKVGVTGTPSFFLNGEKMEFESYLEFAQQIGYAIDPSLAASSTASTTGATPEGVRFGF